jgi:hypothetical protein
MGAGLKGLRAKYRNEIPPQRPPFVDERSWAIFTAYIYEQRTVPEIGELTKVSPSRVRQILHRVDAELNLPGPTLVKKRELGPESLIEDLTLSVRARNALRSLGCRCVGDLLHLDLASSIRGIGRKTREEIIAALREAGFHHPSTEDSPDPELSSLERSLERLQHRINLALSAVTKEIRVVRTRLRSKLKASG